MPPAEEETENMGKRREILFGIGIFMGVLGASLLVGFGLRYLKPYLEVRGYEEGECTIVQSSFDNEPVTCQCSRDAKSPCRSRYPCLRLIVNFTASLTGASAANITLYDSFETFRLQHHERECSFHKCHRQWQNNHNAVTKFAKEYGNLMSHFKCYYDPAEPFHTILTVVTLTTVVHTLLWPSLAVIFGSAIVIFYIFCSPPSDGRNYPSSSLDRVKNINRENRYERVETR